MGLLMVNKRLVVNIKKRKSDHEHILLNDVIVCALKS